jgi:uncharacterized protein YydD (DUF2326 family)
MLKGVKSNHASFKTVEFKPGFNVILADRIILEGNKDVKRTRNGAGKTTLVEIIHFCLGANVRRKSIFRKEALQEWAFTLTIEINGKEHSITREVKNPQKIYVTDYKELGLFAKTTKKFSRPYVTIPDLNKCLGLAFYSDWIGEKEAPFRSLISYAVRRSDREVLGFSDPFTFFNKQNIGDIQSINAYFLGLNVEYALLYQTMRDKEKGLKNYKSAVSIGIVGDISLNKGKLSDEIFETEKKVKDFQAQLNSFKIHPQYSEIAKEADILTQDIHNISNELIIKRQLLTRYEQTANEEEIEIPIPEIEALYLEAGIIFTEKTKKRLEEVIAFHEALIKNRKEYLSAEILRLSNEIEIDENKIERINTKRAKNLAILSTNGALDEYTALQEKLDVKNQVLANLRKQLEQAEYIEKIKSQIAIEKGELQQKALHDYKERESIRRKAVSIFKENTGFLYNEPATLSIDLKETGYAFDIEIKRAKSQGVSYMKLFCYDLLLLQLGLEKKEYPNFLIHDSTIFDGVDERQIASALCLANKKSGELNAQYICMMNSDTVPQTEFDDDFKRYFEEHIILRLDDNSENGGLLGIRFD